LLAILLKEKPWSRENLKYSRQRHYIKLAVATALNGFLFQFAAAWVSGSLAQVLANFAIIQIPFFEFFLIRERFEKYKHHKRHWFGLTIVLLGLILGCVGAVREFVETSTTAQPSEQSNKWYWVICFILSTTANAWQQVAEDQAFHDPEVKIEKVTCLAWLNMCSIPAYLFAIPFQCIPYVNGLPYSMSLTDAFINQYNAFRCFFHLTPPADLFAAGACLPGATKWVSIFCLGYIGLFAVNAWLIWKYGVIFSNIVGSVVQLVAALVFMCPFIMGEFAANFTYWPIIGCVVILVGIFVKGTPADESDKGGKNDPHNNS